MLASGCHQEAPPPAKSRQACIQFSCDVSGRIEPCGCFTGQLGGLTRLKTVLDAAQEPSLRVDVGDAIAGSEDYQVMQYREVLRALHLMGYHAANAGRREASLSAATLTSLAKESPVPLISANLFDVTTHAPVLRPWLVAEAGGLRYGIIGIVDPASLPEGGLGAGLSASDPASAISALLPEVRRAADVVVLLAFATEDRMKELAAQFFELQFILGGDVQQPSQDLVRANRSLLLSTTNQGRAIGLIKAKMEAGRPVSPSHAILMLNPDIPQSKDIAALAATYRENVRSTRLAVDDPSRTGANDVPGVHATATFVGTEACAGCHAAEFATWQKTGHAEAWKALVRRDSEADPSCIGCHSVGFGAPSGYRREMKGEKFVNVGCESCHGPGSRHVAERAATVGTSQAVAFHFRPLGAADCTDCHHGEFSRPFEFADFWAKVAHGPAKR